MSAERAAKVPSKSKVIRALQRRGFTQASRNHRGFSVYGSDAEVLVGHDLRPGDPNRDAVFEGMRSALMGAGYAVSFDGTSLSVRSR